MNLEINTSNWVLGGDVCGTFTDLVLTADHGRLVSAKTPTTSAHSNRVSNAHKKIADILEMSYSSYLNRCSLIVHGTTVATNTLLEYNGAKVGLLTTGGFRDEIEFRRAYKESVFNVRLKAPNQIVPRRYRIGIPERL